MRDELTDRLVASLSPPAADAKSASRIIYDSAKNAPAGFGVRISRGGARTFILDYRARGGATRRLKIGTFDANGIGGWKVAAARRRAGDVKRAIDVGDDPAAALARDRSAPTMADLCERYLDEHAREHKSDAAGDQSLIDQFVLSEWRNRHAGEITREDVRKLHRKITREGITRDGATRPSPAQRDLFQAKARKARAARPAPIRANRLVTLLHKIFGLAIEWGMRADNPATRIKRNPEQPRQRYLSPEEISRLSSELARPTDQASADAVRLLLLTGARLGEVLSASWEQFDFVTGVWTKPSAHTKQKREHRVPLSAGAKQLLAEMKQRAAEAAAKTKREPSRHLFPGRRKNETQTTARKFWATVCKRAKISGVRLHDLRHTHASILASAGLSLPIIGQLLGHTQPSTTARYAHLFDDPLRQAAQRVDDFVTAAGAGRSAEIHDFPKRGDNR